MARVGRRKQFLCALVLGLSQLACDQTGPSGPSFVVVCNPSSLFVGQTGFCFASVNGTDPELEATWSSSDPTIASFGPIGSLKGRSAGQVVVTASYQGRSESASVSVRAEDVVQVSSGGYQGTYRVGDTLRIIVVGFYGVASADTGQLNLVVTDQNGAVVSESEPRIVSRGGDSLVIDHTLTVPVGVTRLCRTAVLRIGPVTLTSTGSSQIFPCVEVQ